MFKFTRLKSANRVAGGRFTLVVIMGWLASLAMAGCAPTGVQTISESTGEEPLPTPARVLIYDFAVSPQEVSLDSAIGKRLARLMGGTPQTEEQLKVGRAVADALAKNLVKDIQKLGLPAERYAGALTTAGNVLVIEGQFLTIDESNQLRQAVIGLGASGTKVRTQVQVYQVTLMGRRLVEEFVTTAQSSRKPGMAETMGARAATAAAVSGEVTAATASSQMAEVDARRAADKITQELAYFFAANIGSQRM